MKRTGMILTLILLCVNIFAQSGVVRELTGTVEIKTAGASGFVPAVPGMEVRQDTLISTGFKSMALIDMGSTVISIRPLTRMSLTEIQASAGVETINVNLQAGRIRVDVKPPAGTRASMSVTSPIATASVHGTGLFQGRKRLYDTGRERFVQQYRQLRENSHHPQLLYYLPPCRDSDRIYKASGTHLGVDVVYHHFDSVNGNAVAYGNFRTSESVSQVDENFLFSW